MLQLHFNTQLFMGCLYIGGTLYCVGVYDLAVAFLEKSAAACGARDELSHGSEEASTGGPAMLPPPLTSMPPSAAAAVPWVRAQGWAAGQRDVQVVLPDGERGASEEDGVSLDLRPEAGNTQATATTSRAQVDAGALEDLEEGVPVHVIEGKAGVLQGDADNPVAATSAATIDAQGSASAGGRQDGGTAAVAASGIRCVTCVTGRQDGFTAAVAASATAAATPEQVSQDGAAGTAVPEDASAAQRQVAAVADAPAPRVDEHRAQSSSVLHVESTAALLSLGLVLPWLCAARAQFASCTSAGGSGGGPVAVSEGGGNAVGTADGRVQSQSGDAAQVAAGAGRLAEAAESRQQQATQGEKEEEEEEEEEEDWDKELEAEALLRGESDLVQEHPGDAGANAPAQTHTSRPSLFSAVLDRPDSSRSANRGGGNDICGARAGGTGAEGGGRQAGGRVAAGLPEKWKGVGMLAGKTTLMSNPVIVRYPKVSQLYALRTRRMTEVATQAWLLAIVETQRAQYQDAVGLVSREGTDLASSLCGVLAGTHEWAALHARHCFSLYKTYQQQDVCWSYIEQFFLGLRAVCTTAEAEGFGNRCWSDMDESSRIERLVLVRVAHTLLHLAARLWVPERQASFQQLLFVTRTAGMGQSDSMVELLELETLAHHRGVQESPSHMHDVVLPALVRLYASAAVRLQGHEHAVRKAHLEEGLPYGRWNDGPALLEELGYTPIETAVGALVDIQLCCLSLSPLTVSSFAPARAFDNRPPSGSSTGGKKAREEDGEGEGARAGGAGDASGVVRGGVGEEHGATMAGGRYERTDASVAGRVLHDEEYRMDQLRRWYPLVRADIALRAKCAYVMASYELQRMPRSDGITAVAEQLLLESLFVLDKCAVAVPGIKAGTLISALGEAVLTRYADVLFDQGKYRFGILALEAAAECNKLRSRSEPHALYRRLAVVSADNGDHERSLRYHGIALNAARQSGICDEYVFICERIADLLLEHGDLQQAEHVLCTAVAFLAGDGPESTASLSGHPTGADDAARECRTAPASNGRHGEEQHMFLAHMSVALLTRARHAC
jgi:hypothetical protein